ncbi:MAG TPA: hypothetical protein VMD29_12260 [Terracidiphilus sp.]|nr:hypothetical protein [Terracidiphilus sp.]
MRSISDSELDTLVSLGSSIDLTFFGITAGAFVSLIITVFTVSIPAAREFAAFIGATILTAILALFFGIRGVKAYSEGQKLLKTIRSGNPATPAPAALDASQIDDHR